MSPSGVFTRSKTRFFVRQDFSFFFEFPKPVNTSPPEKMFRPSYLF